VSLCAPLWFALPMTRRRWIADEVSGSHAILTGAHAEHLSRVLRARVGQVFDVVAAGELRRGRVSHVDNNRVEFELGEVIPAADLVPITLALSIFKFDRMEWAIEKCTELGAARIVPVIAHRTEPHLAAAAPKRVERWQRIAREAAEQSRRLSPPEIAPPVKLKDVVAISAHTRIVLAEVEDQLMLKDAVRGHSSGDIVLAFGPEGGWTDAELQMFRESGWTWASLGSTILRAETAAIAALAVVLAEMQPTSASFSSE
jgi:16S rRNA (uracil1498-N3)-methyltransferase